MLQSVLGRSLGLLNHAHSKSINDPLIRHLLRHSHPRSKQQQQFPCPLIFDIAISNEWSIYEPSESNIIGFQVDHRPSSSLYDSRSYTTSPVGLDRLANLRRDNGRTSTIWCVLLSCCLCPSYRKSPLHAKIQPPARHRLYLRRRGTRLPIVPRPGLAQPGRLLHSPQHSKSKEPIPQTQ